MFHRLVIALANLWIYVSYIRVIAVHVVNTGQLPNPALPKTVNDKFLWRKIFDRNPQFIPLSDKLESQNIARQRCADVLIPKVLWTGTNARDIPGELLTGNVMLKATHGSGYVHPVFNGQHDRKEIEAIGDSWMRESYGWHHWEWGYFGVEPKLYVEEMILDEDGGYRTTEAKMYVYCGRIEQIVMIYDRHLEASATVYHGDWTESSEEAKITAAAADRAPPENRRRIEDIALQLSQGLDHIRCDLYLVGDQIWFGEYTVYNLGGYVKLTEDLELLTAHSRSWDLRQSWFLQQKHTGLKAVYANSLTALMQH